MFDWIGGHAYLYRDCACLRRSPADSAAHIGLLEVQGPGYISGMPMKLLDMYDIWNYTLEKKDNSNLILKYTYYSEKC